MNKLTLFAICAATAFGAEALTIENVVARQRLPWNALVDVEFDLTGGAADEKYVVELTATSASGLKTYVAKSLLTDPVVGPGSHRLTWDLASDYPNVRADDFEIRVTAKTLDDESQVYCVIDVAGGKDATRYPVRYTTTPPVHSAGNTNDVCKLTEIWLKRVHPANRTFVGNSNAEPTENNDAMSMKLSKDYYLGVFEVTQQQWFQLTGTWPSRMSNELWRATRPLDRYYPYLLFGSGGWNWPDAQTPKSGSLLEKLRVRTGLSGIGLPTDAQWSFAAKAGAPTGKASKCYLRPDGTEYEINEVARCSGNGGSTTDDLADFTAGSAPVGSYAPNVWGFYDMIGNVSEDCLDPYASSAVRKAYYVEKGIPFPLQDPQGLPQNEAQAGSGRLAVTYAGGEGFRSSSTYSGLYKRAGGYLNYPGEGKPSPARGIRLCVTCE